MLFLGRLFFEDLLEALDLIHHGRLLRTHTHGGTHTESDNAHVHTHTQKKDDRHLTVHHCALIF